MPETTTRTADAGQESDLARNLEGLNERDMERFVTGMTEQSRSRLLGLLGATGRPERTQAPAAREAPTAQPRTAETVSPVAPESNEDAAPTVQTEPRQTTAERGMDGRAEVPPPGGAGAKTWRLVKTAGLSAGAGAGLLAATQGTGLSNAAIFNVPALHATAASIKAAATSVAGWTPWLSWLAYPLKAAAWAAPGLAAGAATLGGGYIAGRLWEKFQRDVCGEKIPERSFTKRVWVGLTTPIRIPLYALEKFGPPAAKWTWKHKWKFAGGLTLGALLAAAGAITAPAALVGGLAAGAVSALIPEKHTAEASATP